MRVLQLHCDSIEYTPTKKEIKSAEEIDPKKTVLEEVVVCFIAVEDDDDSTVGKTAISEIQESMKKIGRDRSLIKETLYGTFRWYIQLEYILDQLDYNLQPNS